MFGTHVNKLLSAYAHGELSPVEAAQVVAHLDACAACRAEFEEIKLGIRLAESLPSVAAPASLWEGIEASLSSTPTTSRRKAPELPAPPRFTFFSGWRRFAAVGAAACVALLVGAVWFYLAPPRAGWEVSSLAGAPLIDSERIGQKGRLTVGDWLETDKDSRVEIKVANIGEIEVDPNTRLRLVETRMTEHRLELQRGRLRAKIWAPPRLFFVNTPSAVAADLGCAYTLEVDDRERSLLHVTSGWVALETGARESFVPAGAACETRPGVGPGTPYFEDAPMPLIAALTKFDFEHGGAESLDIVLSAARQRDTLTLWHLLSRVGETERALVYDRLAALTPPPDGLTREGVLRLERGMLDKWKNRLEETWMFESFPTLRKTLRQVLTK
jgi:ferric-dicitrate binding protein FerR (iron transport regulator)